MKSFHKKALSLALGLLVYGGVFLIAPHDASAVCNVTSMGTRPNGVQPVQIGDIDGVTQFDFPAADPNVNPYRNENNGYPEDGYDSSNANFPPFVYVDIVTNGCEGETLSLYISNAKQSPTFFEWNYYNYITVLNIGPTSPTSPPGHQTPGNSFTVAFRAGDMCNSGPGQHDCQWVFSIFGNTDGSFWQLARRGQAWYWPANPSPNDVWLNMGLDFNDNGILYVAEEFQSGVTESQLTYECESCAAVMEGNEWQFVSIIGYGATSASDAVEDVDFFDSDSIFTEGYDQYLAPLPGFSTTATSTLPGFLKGLFNVLIMLAGILAFIMLVIGGITYATADAIMGKADGKAMILNAILGLIIALGAWVILNTINPNLASNLTITIPKANFVPRLEPETGAGPGVETITLNTTSGGTTTMTACDETKIVPITAFNKNFHIHQGLVSSIHAVEQQWLAMPPDQRYKIKDIGGYNCRRVNGTNSWSSHAFGTAVDINHNQNPFTNGALVTDMPPSFVQMWTSQGWGWGGNWTSVKDAMHFSKYPPQEQGNGIIQE